MKPKKNHIFFASESVGEGHPDKFCDQVSDSILDACIRVDPAAKVAMETATKSNVICLMGETGITKKQVDFEKCARRTACQIGFDSVANGLDGNKCKVI
jgi:S-adenosylmethionine synthetase